MENFVQRLNELQDKTSQFDDEEKKDNFNKKIDNLKEKIDNWNEINNEEIEEEIERMETELKDIEQEKEKEKQELSKETKDQLEILSSSIEANNLIESWAKIKIADSIDLDLQETKDKTRKITFLEKTLRSFWDIWKFIANVLWGKTKQENIDTKNDNEKISELLEKKWFADNTDIIKWTFNIINQVPFDKFMKEINNENNSIADIQVYIDTYLSSKEEPENLNFNQKNFLEKYITLIRLNKDYINENMKEKNHKYTISDINDKLFSIWTSQAVFNEWTTIIDWKDYYKKEEWKKYNRPNSTSNWSQLYANEIYIDNYESLQNLTLEQIRNLDEQNILDILDYSIQDSIKNSWNALPINISYFKDQEKQKAYEKLAWEKNIEIPNQINFNDNYQLVIWQNNYIMKYEWNSINPFKSRERYQAKPNDWYQMWFENDNWTININLDAEIWWNYSYRIDYNKFSETVSSLIYNWNYELTWLDAHNRIWNKIKFMKT